MAKGRKVELRKIVVEGHGGFPLDMLRRDSCFPMESGDLDRMMWHPDDSGYFDIRQISLITASVRTTPDRWESYGWKLISEEPLI